MAKPEPWPFNKNSAAEKKQDEVPSDYLAHINALDEYKFDHLG